MEIRREDRLLLKCLCAGDDQGKSNGLERLSSSGWDRLIQRSLRHSVTPLLYDHLKKNANVPDRHLERLRDIYLQSAVMSIRLFHKLSKVLQLINDSGIPVIVLKGACLAEVVYRNPALRTMYDVDLLFMRRDLTRAQKILMDAGYDPHSAQLFLDIHWDIDLTSTPLSIEMEGIWERAQPCVIADVEVLVLSTEDLLIHLCVHLSYHHLFGAAGLRTLYDIRETIRYYSGRIQWEVVRDRSREWGIGNSVRLTLLLARDLLNADVPDKVLEGLRQDDLDPRVKTWAMEQIFNHRGASLDLSPHFSLLWNSGTLLEKASHFLKLLIPSTEFISQKYPAPHRSLKNYLFYLVRLKDHLSRYCRATWRILVRDEEMRRLVREKNRNLAMREWLSS